MKKKFKSKDIIPTIYICAFLMFLLIGSFYVINGTFGLYTYSLIMTYLGVIGYILYITSKILYKRKLSFYDILIILLIICGIISYLFSIDSITSLYGFYGRNEGLHILLTYYIVFLISKDIECKRCKEIIINMVILFGIVNFIYGCLQFLDVPSVFSYKIVRMGWYATGLVSNANFFGTTMILSLGLSLGLYISSSRIIPNIYYGFLSFLFFIGILLSGTMSAILTFAILLILIIILLIRSKPKFKNMLIKSSIIIALFVLGYLFFNYFDNGSLFKETKETANEIVSVTDGNTNQNFGTGRLYIWGETLKRFPKYIFTGSGIDTFYYAFGESPLVDPVNGLNLDKAHNEYLQKAFTEGIFSIICYLILLLTIFIKAFKKILIEKNILNGLLISTFLGFSCYCIQAFFNISIIRIAPFFYTIMGLLTTESKILKTREIANDGVIPKVINYVWVGSKKGKKELRCIGTWKKNLTDYKIIEWNENNFDMNMHPYLKKAYKEKKWAYVSDYIRAYVIYNYGGIYLDTDVMVGGSFDKFLANNCFIGFENDKLIMTSVFGATKKHPLIKDMLNYFDCLDNFNSPNTVWFTKILVNDYKLIINDKEQLLENDIKVYPKKVFSEPSRSGTSIHIFEGSWVDNKTIYSKVATFFRRYSNYNIIRLVYTKIILKIKKYK